MQTLLQLVRVGPLLGMVNDSPGTPERVGGREQIKVDIRLMPLWSFLG
jgi:hypothetical protein